jgi:hypothetical protein
MTQDDLAGESFGEVVELFEVRADGDGSVVVQGEVAARAG